MLTAERPPRRPVWAEPVVIRPRPQTRWLRRFGAPTLLLAIAVGAAAFVFDRRSASSELVSAPIPAAGAAFQLGAFPVQGKCAYIDSYGAPRGGARLHEGVDIIAPSGNEIYAVFDGEITKQYFAAANPRSGNAVRLKRLNNADYAFYAHLSSFAPGLKIGSRFTTGQVIGYVGKTGNTLQPHLHFELHPGGGVPINPTPAVRAVDTKNCAATAPKGIPPTSDGTTTTTRPAATTTTTRPAPTTTRPAATTTTTRPAPTTTRPAATTTTTRPAATTTAAPLPPPVNAPAARLAVAGSPPRIADTRATGKRLAAGKVAVFQVSGQRGVANSAATAVLNVFVASPAGAGSVTVYPCGQQPPKTATLVFRGASMAGNSVFTGLGSGKVCVVSSVATDVIVDVVAYSGSSNPSMGVKPIKPARVLDTRESAAGLLKAGTKRVVKVTGLNGVPAANAVSITLTALNPTKIGTLAVWACDRARPAVPVLVALSGRATSANTIARVAADGTVCVDASVDVDILLDVHAAWATGGATALRSVAPARLYNQKVGAEAVIELQVAGKAGVPANAKAVAVTVSVSGASGSGNPTVWPCGQARPSTRLMSITAGSSASGSTIMGLGGGKLCVSARVGATLTVDVTGYAA